MIFPLATMFLFPLAPANIPKGASGFTVDSPLTMDQSIPALFFAIFTAYMKLVILFRATRLIFMIIKTLSM